MTIEKLQCDVSLKKKNTLRLDVSTKYYLEIGSGGELEKIIAKNIFPSENILVLGGGSNLLFTRDFQGLVINPNIRGIDVVFEDDNFVHVTVGAGEDWSSFVDYAVSKGWGGVENLAMVPGTVGAAPVQNIACYGQNLHESLLSVDVIILSTGERKTFLREQCRFGYRTSIFKEELQGKCVITEVTLKLNKRYALNTGYTSRYESVESELAQIAKPPYRIEDVYHAIVNIRSRKLPDIHKVGTVGSVFKNPLVTRDQLETIREICPDIHYYPQEHLIYDANLNNDRKSNEMVKIPAAWLIDEMGWAGKRIGNCGIWKTQPLNIVNYGEATPGEFLAVVNLVREAVYERYAIELETEVVVV